MIYLHDFYDLAMLGTLVIAVFQILWLRKKVSEMHDKLCCKDKAHGEIDDEIGL